MSYDAVAVRLVNGDLVMTHGVNAFATHAQNATVMNVNFAEHFKKRGMFCVRCTHELLFKFSLGVLLCVYLLLV